MISKRDRLRVYILEIAGREIDDLKERPLTDTVKYEILLRMELVRNTLMGIDRPASKELVSLRERIGYADKGVVTKIRGYGANNLAKITTYLNIYSVYKLYIENGNLSESAIKFADLVEGYKVPITAFNVMLSTERGTIEYDKHLNPAIPLEDDIEEDKLPYNLIYSLSDLLDKIDKHLSVYTAMMNDEQTKHYSVVDGVITVYRSDDIPHIQHDSFYNAEYSELITDVDGRPVISILQEYRDYLVKRIKHYENEIASKTVSKG